MNIVTRINEKFVNKNIARVMSLLFVATSIFAMYVFYRSTLVKYEQSIANWQIASTLAMILVPIMLSASERDVYWGAGGRKKLDERQINVRRRVYEKSYMLLILIIPLVTFLGGAWAYGSFLDNTLPESGFGVPIVDVLFFLYALPCAIAAWQKDA